MWVATRRHFKIKFLLYFPPNFSIFAIAFFSASLHTLLRSRHGLSFYLYCEHFAQCNFAEPNQTSFYQLVVNYHSNCQLDCR